MDCRTHERGVGMLNTPYVKKDTIKNFFPVPNAVFDLGLHHMEISIYAYLLRIEDRRTYQCIVSYPTIARKLGISVNTVAKYVAALEEHGLIRTERMGSPLSPLLWRVSLKPTCSIKAQDKERCP